MDFNYFDQLERLPYILAVFRMKIYSYFDKQELLNKIARLSLTERELLLSDTDKLERPLRLCIRIPHDQDFDKLASSLSEIQYAAQLSQFIELDFFPSQHLLFSQIISKSVYKIDRLTMNIFQYNFEIDFEHIVVEDKH